MAHINFQSISYKFNNHFVNNNTEANKLELLDGFGIVHFKDNNKESLIYIFHREGIEEGFFNRGANRVINIVPLTLMKKSM